MVEANGVRNVDQLAIAIVREHEGAMPGILDDQAELVVWGAAADTVGVDLAADFLRQEWRQVIAGNGISRRDDYFAVARAGRGGRLTRRERIDIWRVVEEFLKHTERPGRRTYLQLADDATLYLRSRVVSPVCRCDCRRGTGPAPGSLADAASTGAEGSRRSVHRR